VSRLPEHMQEGAKAYVEHGRMPGGFMHAVLTNDLVGAVGHADATNAEALQEWVRWMYNDIPAPAWGSEEAVLEWIEQDGLEGL